jgi:membrane-anchored glycerophosphoryl diester phosphodiesterase (GDPDase)
MTIIISITIGFGFALFIIPGIYLLGRLIVAAPAMVAENRRNPIQAIGESWRLTKGRGWAIAGLVLVVGIAGGLLTFVVLAVLGSVFILVGGREGIGGLLVLILNAALNAALYTVIIVLIAAVYRALRGGAEAGVDLNKGI